MNRFGTLRYPRLSFGAAALVLLTALVPLGAELWVGDSDLLPQGQALDWEPVLTGLHLIINTLIGLAYVAISATLIYLARKTGQSIPFLWVFVAFGVFIISCGLTHFMAALTLWEPMYWLAGGILYITPISSVGTAVAIPPLVPKVQKLIESAKLSEKRQSDLEQANKELEKLNEALEAKSRELSYKNE